MKIIIFGATGPVGKELVKQALHKGHHVKAYGRNVFTEDLPKVDSLELVQGALFDEIQVYKAMKGCDAVLMALSGGSAGTDLTRSLGTKNIVAQMQKAGLKLIIAVGGFAVLNADEDTMIMDTGTFPQEDLVVAGEHLKAYQLLKGSDLTWTFVCPADITNGEVTGQYTTKADYLPDFNKFTVNTGDLALFMLNELERKEYSGHRVGISN